MGYLFGFCQYHRRTDSDERYDLSNFRIESYIIDRFMATGIESLKPILHDIDLLDLCRPYLYKSTEYSREKEWRLICKWGNRNNKYANIVDFDKLKRKQRSVGVLASWSKSAWISRKQCLLDQAEHRRHRYTYGRK